MIIKPSVIEGGSTTNRGTLLPAFVGALVLWACGGSPSAADGFHNAALKTASLDEWTADLARSIPELAGSSQLEAGRDLDALKREAAGTSGTGRPTGGSLYARLTPQQQQLLQRKGQDCMQILAYLDSDNIIPREFPKFQHAMIPNYRAKAKQILGAMGPAGASLVSNALRAELMGAGGRGLPRHPDYRDDLLEILVKHLESGQVSAADMQQLQEALAGAKGPDQEALAAKIGKALSLDGLPLEVVVGLASSVRVEEFRDRCRNEILKRTPRASILELLKAQSATSDPDLRGRFRRELADRSPRYSEVEHQIRDIWELSRSADSEVAAAAQSHTVNAFQRAPMHHCLYWIGEGDSSLSALIWEQIDGRIGRADADRRAGYRKSALAVLGHSGFTTASRSAAIDLLARLDDRQAAGQVIEHLLDLPRELWPEAGGLLRQWTGQDFGPRAGDTAAEALRAKKQWETWWNANGRKQ